MRSEVGGLKPNLRNTISFRTSGIRLRFGWRYWKGWLGSKFYKFRAVLLVFLANYSILTNSIDTNCRTQRV